MALAGEYCGAIVSIPVFCDSGFVILSPLNRSLASETKQSLATFAVALSMGLYATRTLFRPHLDLSPLRVPLKLTSAQSFCWGFVLQFRSSSSPIFLPTGSVSASGSIPMERVVKCRTACRIQKLKERRCIIRCSADTCNGAYDLTSSSDYLLLLALLPQLPGGKDRLPKGSFVWEILTPR
ncbi:MAG: hypothetical protein U5K69_27195 [Balneolaceae bacterium]|nr:hypothetical protein [Balneolaceae bacterium]